MFYENNIFVYSGYTLKDTLEDISAYIQSNSHHLIHFLL